MFTDDGSSAASLAAKGVAPAQEAKQEPERPPESPVALKSMPKPTESAKVLGRDFDSSEAPQIIESRLSNNKIKQEAQKGKPQLDSVKRDDHTIGKIKYPEKIDYEEERSMKQDSKSLTKERI